MTDEDRDPDNLYDDAVVFEIDIKVMGDGSMKVSGDINDKQYALACIEEAKNTVIRHHLKPQIFIPTPDKIYRMDEITYAIQIKCRRNGSMSTGGSINDKKNALSILDHARTAVIEYHRKLETGGTVNIPTNQTDFISKEG